MTAITGLEFRWLQGDDLDQLEPTIRARGWVPLNKAMSRVLAVYDGERIVGWIAFNMIPHVEPLFIEPEYRGSGIAEQLAEGMVNWLYAVEAPAAYIVADSPASQRLAEAHGMERVTSPVYRIVR